MLFTVIKQGLTLTAIIDSSCKETAFHNRVDVKWTKSLEREMYRRSRASAHNVCLKGNYLSLFYTCSFHTAKDFSKFCQSH